MCSALTRSPRRRCPIDDPRTRSNTARVASRQSVTGKTPKRATETGRTHSNDNFCVSFLIKNGRKKPSSHDFTVLKRMAHPFHSAETTDVPECIFEQNSKCLRTRRIELTVFYPFLHLNFMISKGIRNGTELTSVLPCLVRRAKTVNFLKVREGCGAVKIAKSRKSLSPRNFGSIISSTRGE